MKKFLTLVLALVMVLAIAAPAMAFTSKENSTDSPYDLDIYLVEYDDNGFGTFTMLPPSDRGYAKNEVVAAVAELFVPKGEDVYNDFDFVEISGENVTFNVSEDVVYGTDAPTLSPVGTDGADGWEYDVDAGGAGVLDGKATFKWLVFAKVTGDDASLTFALRGPDADWGTDGDELAIPDYIVTVSTDGFIVSTDATTPVELFEILVDDDDETIGLKIKDGTMWYTVVETINGFVFVDTDGKVWDDEDDDTYEDLMEIFEEEFADEFGFDWDLMGGVVDKGTFEDILGSVDLEVSVDIAPWTAYVTVPDNIVVDPPKTGDAASILGFVMIVLAAAAVVAVRKVRA